MRGIKGLGFRPNGKASHTPGPPVSNNFAIQFTGEVELDHTFAAGLDGERFCAMGWFRLDEANLNKTILMFVHGITRDSSGLIDSDLLVVLDTGDNEDAPLVSIALDTWHHVCVLFRPTVGTAKLFLNGVSTASCVTGGVGLDVLEFAISAANLDAIKGAVTSFKYGYMASDITALEVQAEMATRTAIKSGLTAVSLNGADDLGIFTAVGAGSISTIDGPEALA